MTIGCQGGGRSGGKGGVYGKYFGQMVEAVQRASCFQRHNKQKSRLENKRCFYLKAYRRTSELQSFVRYFEDTGIENFYLRYGPAYSSCSFGTTILNPNADQLSHNQFPYKLEDRGQFSRNIKCPIITRFLKCLLHSNTINISRGRPHS